MIRLSKVEYSYKKRFLGISIREKRELKKWKTLLVASGILKAGGNSQLSPELDNIQAFFAHMYLKLVLEPTFTLMCEKE